MKKLLSLLLVTIQIIFKLFLRLTLLIFSLLGIGSAYSLTTINPDDLTLEALDKEVEKDCGHLLPDNPDAYGNCWEGWMLSAGGLPALIIIAVVFVRATLLYVDEIQKMRNRNPSGMPAESRRCLSYDSPS